MRWFPLVLLLAAPALRAQDPAPADSGLVRALAYIRAAAQEEMREDQVPGLALAVVAEGRIVAVQVFGVADLASGTPVTPDTRFLAGSVSKTLTAIALLQLQEEGLMDVRQPVTTYLPWFRVRSRWSPITLHHLLTHTAGLPRDRSDLPSSPYTAVSLKDREVGGPPGERFAYSNIGYQLLSLAIEEVEGRPFAASIQRRILEPLGMHNTLPAVTQAGRLTSATGYQFLYDDRPPVPGEPLVPVAWTESAAGDANLVTTAPDLARLLIGLLDQGAPPGRRLLQPVSFARMVQRTVPTPELCPDCFYGYGVVVGMEDGDPVLWHSGGMPGFRAMLLGDLDQRLGVVILMNGPGNPRRLAGYALQTLLAARWHRPLPPVVIAAPPEIIPNAAGYAGRYEEATGDTLIVTASEDRLYLSDGSRRLPLLRSAPDEFIVADSVWSLFPVRFLRQGGRVTELVHGGRWLATERYEGPRSFNVPGAWKAYPGHYRAQVPYDSNYRVVIRKGELRLVSPEGVEEMLVPLGGGEFRVGQDERAVERLRFEDVVSGRALRLNLSGTDYYRSTTP